MTFSNYGELQTAVADWLHRSDLSNTVKSFISLAESRLNRLLSLRSEEIDAQIHAVAGSAYAPLPENYNAPVSLWLETVSPRQTLVFMPPAELPYVAAVSSPTYWTVKAKQIQFDRIAGDNYPLTLRYVRKFALSDTEPTNSLLTDYPDAYLYGALLESAPFIRDDSRIAMWQERFDRAINEIQNQEDKSKGIVLLGVDPGMQSGHYAFNIFEG